MTTTTTITTITNGPSAGPAQSLGGAQSGAPGAGVGTAAPNNGTGAPNRGAGYLPGVVLTVVGSANKSVHVTTPGGVTPMYSMATAFEGHREVVTIAHGAPAPTGPTKLVRPGTNGGEAPLARLELHGLLADKLSLHGAPAVKFSHWLVGTGANVHSFTVEGEHSGTYTWRKQWQSLEGQMDLFGPGSEEPIAFVHKDHGGPAPQDPAYTSAAPNGGNGLPAASQAQGTGQHMAAHAHPANATITLTPRAVPIQDWVVVSYLLLDRETRRE